MASGVPGGVDPSHPGLLVAATSAVTTIVGGFALWLANRLLGKAAFQTAINDGFAKLTSGQEKAFADAEVRWAAERASLKGEIRNLMQSIESLQRELRRHGIPIPHSASMGREPDAGATIIDGDKP